MKLLLDEMISDQVAERLRHRGHDVISATADPSLRGSSDPDLFAAAQEQERILATYNRDDFLAIVQRYAEEGREHHGLLIVHPKRHPNDQFARLADALDSFMMTFTPQPSFVAWLAD